MADPLSQIRILVVDDNKQMRTIVGTVLAAAGVRHLFYAADGRDALDKMNEVGGIDCAYVDFEMPGMNGLDFVSRVRGSENGVRYLPIVMITGYSDMAHLSLARDRGVTEFLRKPVTARDILMRLEAVIMRPRHFVTSETYFGPDRRRKRQTAYLGARRRQGDHKELVEI